MADNEQQAGTQQNAQQFALQRLYVRDVSFEAPQGSKVFGKQWRPQVKVDLNTASERVGDDQFEVVLTITATATLEEETAFLAEVQQAGLFLVRGLEGEDLRRVLSVMCPTILFPYAREAVDGLAVRGSFPALMLQPINFEALYLQAVQQGQQQPAEAH